jgi:hypothetical protein
MVTSSVWSPAGCPAARSHRPGRDGVAGCRCCLVVAVPAEARDGPCGCGSRVSGTVRPLARHSLTSAAKMGGSPWDVLAKSPYGACLASLPQRRRPVVTVQSMLVQRNRVRGWYALGPAWPHRMRLLPSFGAMCLSDEIVTETPDAGAGFPVVKALPHSAGRPGGTLAIHRRVRATLGAASRPERFAGGLAGFQVGGDLAEELRRCRRVRRSRPGWCSSS